MERRKISQRFCQAATGCPLDGFGLRPRPVPILSPRNKKRNQQRRPSGEALDAFGNAARCGGGRADEAGEAFIEPVHADETQVDERGHAQAHVIDPDQNAEEIISEHPHEHLQTPRLEARSVRRGIFENAENCVNRAVLIIPGRHGHLFEECENDRRHPQSPAQDLNRVFGQFGNALAGKHPPDRRGVALEQRGEERAVDGKQPRRHAPADHAFQRFVEEQFRAAGVSAELNVPPLAEQRIKFIHRRFQPKSVVKIELVQHDGNLRAVEIERERAADKRAQHAFHQIQAPRLEPAAVPHAVNQIAQCTDAGISKRARCQTERDALRSRKCRQIHVQRDGAGNSNDHAARHQRRLAIGSQCATKK